MSSLIGPSAADDLAVSNGAEGRTCRSSQASHALATDSPSALGESSSTSSASGWATLCPRVCPETGVWARYSVPECLGPPVCHTIPHAEAPKNDSASGESLSPSSSYTKSSVSLGSGAAAAVELSMPSISALVCGPDCGESSSDSSSAIANLPFLHPPYTGVAEPYTGVAEGVERFEPPSSRSIPCASTPGSRSSQYFCKPLVPPPTNLSRP